MNFGITESPHVVTNLGKNVFLKNISLGIMKILCDGFSEDYALMNN